MCPTRTGSSRDCVIRDCMSTPLRRPFPQTGLRHAWCRGFPIAPGAINGGVKCARWRIKSVPALLREDCCIEALGFCGPYSALVFSGLFTLRRRRRDCLQKIFCRRFVAKSHVRTALIIIDPPSLNQALCLGEALGIGDESARFYGGIVMN